MVMVVLVVVMAIMARMQKCKVSKCPKCPKCLESKMQFSPNNSERKKEQILLKTRDQARSKCEKSRTQVYQVYQMLALNFSSAHQSLIPPVVSIVHVQIRMGQCHVIQILDAEKNYATLISKKSTAAGILLRACS